MSQPILQAAVTKTATFNGAGLDISAISDAWIKIRVNTLSNSVAGVNGLVKLEIQDTVDGFTNSKVIHVEHFKGPIPPDGVVRSINFRNLHLLRRGVASAQIRLAITDISANTTINYQAWLEANA